MSMLFAGQGFLEAEFHLINTNLGVINLNRQGSCQLR
jgi:hypothetical protein